MPLTGGLPGSRLKLHETQKLLRRQGSSPRTQHGVHLKVCLQGRRLPSHQKTGCVLCVTAAAPSAAKGEAKQVVQTHWLLLEADRTGAFHGTGRNDHNAPRRSET